MGTIRSCSTRECHPLHGHSLRGGTTRQPLLGAFLACFSRFTSISSTCPAARKERLPAGQKLQRIAADHKKRDSSFSSTGDLPDSQPPRNQWCVSRKYAEVPVPSGKLHVFSAAANQQTAQSRFQVRK